MTERQRYAREYYLKNRKKFIKRATDYGKRVKMQKRRNVVEMLGGKCQVCGYDKNYSALHIHHKNPDLKERRPRGMSWYYFDHLIRKEDFTNLMLICANCHAEIHHPNEDRSLHKKFMQKKLGEIR